MTGRNRLRIDNAAPSPEISPVGLLENPRVAKVEIYTKAFCGYCHRAKALLDSKGVAYEEFDLTMGGPKRQEMIERSGGGMTVPQIFIDGRHIGGCDELHSLNARGGLDPLLA
jgi:glutaredoxin 3